MNDIKSLDNDNPATQGKSVVKIGEQEYTLYFSQRDFMDVEEKFGSYLKIPEMIQRREFTLKHYAYLFHKMVNRYGEDETYSMDDCIDILYTHPKGLAQGQIVVTLAFNNYLMAGVKKSKGKKTKTRKA